MDAYSIAIAVSLVVYVLVGNLAGRTVRHLDDFLVAGRNAPTLLIVGTLVASVISTNSFLGDVGFAYRGYTSVMVLAAPVCVLGFLLGGLYFGRYLRRAGTRTVAEFFGRRFASRRIRVLAGATVMLGLGGYLTAVTMGVGLILPKITELSYAQSLVIVWLGYSAFTFYAGSKGVVITDTIMFLFFTVVGVGAVLLMIHLAGGWVATVEALSSFDAREGMISARGFLGEGAVWTSSRDLWIWFVIFSVSWAIVFAISPWQASRYLMARNEHVVLRSACVSTCMLALIWSVVSLAAPVIALANPTIDPPEEAMIWGALNLLPTLAGALLLAGIVAAGLSSASTFLSLTGFAITNDVMHHRDLDERRQLQITRIAILVAGIFALAIALVAPPNVFWITTFVAQVFAACWGPVGFMSVWSKNITEAGAFWGMLTGLVACASLKLLDLSGLIDLPVYGDPILVGAILSLVVILVVSAQGDVSEAERRYREALHVAPSHLSDRREAARTMILPWIIMGLGVLSTLLMIMLYVRPYQLANGRLAPGDPYIVFSGELVIALLFGGILFLGGLLAHREIRRIYRTDG